MLIFTGVVFAIFAVLLSVGHGVDAHGHPFRAPGQGTAAGASFAVAAVTLVAATLLLIKLFKKTK